MSIASSIFKDIDNVQVTSNIVNTVGGNQYNYSWYPPVFQERTIYPQVSWTINDAPIDILSIHFTGRKQDLDFLTNALGRYLSDVPRRCAIYGMPGLGKTQLVLQYAKVSFDRYSHIFWTSATSPEKLNQGMAKILDLVGHPDRSLQDQNAKLIAARLWLEEPHEDGPIRWLLILDNVDRCTLDFLRVHLPRKNSRGDILFTTRTAEVAEALANVAGELHSTLKLSTLGLSDTANLLFKDAGMDTTILTPSLISKAENLVKCVGCLPLAVNQAASFMKQSHATLDDMLELYKEERKSEIIGWESDQPSYEERSVAKTFAKQFSQLDKESPDIGNLLKLLSFFDPESIPTNMIIEGAKEHSRQVLSQSNRAQNQPQGRNEGRAETPITDTNDRSHIPPEFASLVALFLSPVQFHTAIQKLQGLSLLERRSNIKDSSLWMHDLIRFMTQERTRKENTHRFWFQCSVLLFTAAFRHIKDPGHPQWWHECEQFMPHLQTLDRTWNADCGTNVWLTVPNTFIAIYLSNQGRIREAEMLHEQVVQVRKIELGPDHLDTLSSMNNLAVVYRSQGRLSEAEKLHSSVLKSREKQLPADHPDTLASMHNLANVYQFQGRSNEAEAFHKRVLATREERLGADHPATLLSMDNLAIVYESQGKSHEAERLHKHVLAIRENLLGADHPDTLSSTNNLANVYQSQGHSSEAEELHKRVLEIRERQLGADHTATLLSLNNLAIVYESQGRSSEAEELHKRVLQRREKQLDAEHPDILSSLHNLAIVYQSLGRLSEAEALYERVLSSRKRQLDADHPDILSSTNNLANVYQMQGRSGEAEQLHKHVLASREKRLDPEHPDTLSSMHNLAYAYQSQGRPSDAEQLLLRIVESQEKQLGPDHPNTLSSKSNLAVVYQLQGRLSEAEELQRRVVGCREKVLGVDHPDTLSSMNNLAIASAQGKPSEAETLHKHVLASREKVLGANHPDTLSSMHNLAYVYQSQGRWDEAERLYTRVLENLETRLGPDHPDTLSSLNNLAIMYESQGRASEAEPLQKRILANRGKVSGLSRQDMFVDNL